MPACLPQEHPDWGAHVRALLAAGPTPPRGGVDAGDHPPITPMRAASGAELSGDAWRLYNMVARNFIGSLCASPRRGLGKLTTAPQCVGRSGRPRGVACVGYMCSLA
jgi:hypothetical protein